MVNDYSWLSKIETIVMNLVYLSWSIWLNQIDTVGVTGIMADKLSGIMAKNHE